MVANVAVKRNGAWKPNFFVIKGDKVCTALKNSQYEVFKLFAKSLNAPDPPSCPLPAVSLYLPSPESWLVASTC